MKNKMKNYLSFTVVALLAIFVTSCGKKMDPIPSSLFSANPSPLEVVGSKVPVTVNGRFPEQWFNKNAVVTVTTVLKYQNKEAIGGSQTYQGENVAGNGILVVQKQGSAFTLKSNFDYIPAMQKSELYLRFEVSVKNKKLHFPDIKVADGVIATATLASATTVTPAEAPDKFQRIIKEAYDSEILFLIQQAELRSSELNSSNLAAWKELVKSVDKDDRKNLDVEISAYASPDGGYKLNEGLAEKREKNTSSYLKKEFQKNNIDTEITAKYTAQDWDGFKKLVEASSLQDKDLVLRVLSMYPDPETRENEIKNISIVYKELAETILPKLRRSRLIANVEIIGKTDQELKNAVDGNMNDLSLEELLYAATLEGTPTVKIYTKTVDKFPNDYRAWNNLGAYLFAKGEMVKANEAFQKAAKITPKAAEPKMNLALFELIEGNNNKAEEMLGLSSGANTLNEAIGLLQLKRGDYNKAAQSFGDTQSNNAALAYIMTKNYSKAQQVLDNVKNKDAVTYYLAAIVSARTNDTGGVVGNLKSSIKMDSSFKQMAKNDLEFAKFIINPDIANMLR